MTFWSEPTLLTRLYLSVLARDAATFVHPEAWDLVMASLLVLLDSQYVQHDARFLDEGTANPLLKVMSGSMVCAGEIADAAFVWRMEDRFKLCPATCTNLDMTGYRRLKDDISFAISESRANGKLQLVKSLWEDHPRQTGSPFVFDKWQHSYVKLHILDVTVSKCKG